MLQQYVQKYTVTCFLEETPTTNFSALEWPLHVTVLDTFKTEWTLDVLVHKLESVAATTAPFEMSPTQAAVFGEDKDIPVKLLQLNNDIQTLHNKLLALAEGEACVFNKPEFVGKGFLPHITDRKNNIEIGDKYRLRNMSLVDMFPNDDHMRRTIIANFDFSIQ